VGSSGRELEGNLDAVVELAHSAEDMRTVADHPDQPGLEVGHGHRTTWVVAVRSGLGPLVQEAGHDLHPDHREQKQEQTQLAKRPGEIDIAG